jgi:hypothetical protein
VQELNPRGHYVREYNVHCISPGHLKKVQHVIFYEITDVPQFRRDLVDFTPMLTTMGQVMKDQPEDAIKDIKNTGTYSNSSKVYHGIREASFLGTPFTHYLNWLSIEPFLISRVG